MIMRYLLPALSAIALTFAAMQMVKAQKVPTPAELTTEPARSPYNSSVAGAGIVEPETENLLIGSPLSGVLEKVLVRVGDTVKPGDPLFRLDDRQIQAELGVRLSNLESARAGLAKLDQMPRALELPPLQARVEEARAGLKNAKTTYDRLKRLTAAGTVAVSDDELTKQLWSVEVAQAQLTKAEADLALSRDGAWAPDKLVSSAQVKQAEATVAQTRIELDRHLVRAPRLRWDQNAGVPMSDTTEFKVLQVNVRPGEFVAAAQGQGLIVLGYVGRLHVRVDIDENDIARFNPTMHGVGKPRGDATREYQLSFVRVDPYVIPKKSLTGGNTERVDTRVLQVLYAIEAKGQPLYVGQQMDVFLSNEPKKTN